MLVKQVNGTSAPPNSTRVAVEFSIDEARKVAELVRRGMTLDALFPDDDAGGLRPVRNALLGSLEDACK